jgi:molecular chaperone GrpE
VPLLPICQSSAVGRYFVKHGIITETEFAMMKKKNREQEELKDKDINKATDNKESNNNPENNPGDGSGNSVSDEGTSPAAGATEEPKGTADKTVTETRATEEKLAEMQDRYIRLSAEFDNYRKRTLREKIELSKYAAEELLLKIIPIMDDFDRALAHMETATDCAAMKDGIDLIYTKFSDFLKQYGIKEIESLNNLFNVDLHDAVAKVPVQEDEKKGKVVDVIQKGYYLQDKVLRHSKVVVGE